MTESVADRVRTIPRPEEPVGVFSWPILTVLAAATTLYAGSAALAVTHTWPWPVSTLVSGFAAFLFFTVSHEASHAVASSNPRLNVWLGRISMPFYAWIGGFGLLRFIHMQHHRFTNHVDGSDPDHYTQAGSRLTLPLRWLTLDLHYAAFYLGHIRTRPRRELVETAITLAVLAAVLTPLVLTGHGFWVLVLYLLPQRIAVVILAWSFDWLPHHGLHDTPKTGRFRTTRNIIGGERLLTPLLLYQNYHLVHHLHPIVPFHRYIAVWRRSEDDYLDHDPTLVTPRGRPITPDEVRRLRELEHHH
ncbi:fatty acid desaturase [Paraconexibacter antarcticus]|uniref:Fatty acid desaturase n=1 Tax=Paraconexibacter antarcticus TaxID=2949664 RepID=A0ABY5DUW9_9ACTN|nr:fatty acid desaturase [Paraconexibacter antarcticus]UTI65290.1 fatty acid desaturase [Paraconexibacter antarcticus]